MGHRRPPVFVPKARPKGIFWPESVMGHSSLLDFCTKHVGLHVI